MAGRRTWLRASAWLASLLVLALLSAGLLGWYAGQRWLREQGIQLDWQGLELSVDGLGLRRLHLYRPGDELRVQAERVHLRWGHLPLHLRQLRIGHLALHQQAAPPADDSPASIDPLRRLAPWLPRDLHIEQFQLTLPCASGHCDLNGALRLRHTGAALPAHLELSLEREERRLQLFAQLQGEPTAARLDLSLALDAKPRLAVISHLEHNPSGWLWSGHLDLPELPEGAWLLNWLSEWHGPPAQALPVPPDALRLRGDWHLQLPPEAPGPASLQQATGSTSFTAHLPAPWPLPGVGQLQGDLTMVLDAEDGQWFPRRTEGDLGLSQLTGDWLAAVPESLRSTTLRLRIQPGEATGDSPLLPLNLQLSSQGPADLTLQAALGITRRPPWTLELNSAHLQGRIARLPLAEANLRELDLDLRASGRLEGEQLSLAFTSGSQLRLGQAGTGQGLRLEQVQADLDGLQVQGRHVDGAWQSLEVRGPTRIRVKRLDHARLQSQGWLWQGQLQADLRQLQLDGALAADSGLNLNLTVDKAVDGALKAEARLPEIFFRASNPLAKTLADWPAVLEMNSGRLLGEARLGLPSGNSPPEMQLQLTFKGLAGIYDRSELNGLDGRLNLRLQANRLHLEVPELRLEQANPGISIGPLRLQADYSAPVAQPLAGRLGWQLAESAFLGGRVWLEPGGWNPAESSERLPLHLHGLGLEQLLLAYPAEGLTGTGLLDGLLPLYLSPSGVRIEQGSLAARPPGGLLQFRSERIQALGRSNPAMRLVAEALDNFHYSRLSSEVSYDEQGKLLLNLRLEGRNPSVEGGRPINFNVNLEEDIPALLTSLQLSDRVNQTIQRRVQEYLRQRQASPP